MHSFQPKIPGSKSKLSSIFFVDDDADDHLIFSMALNKVDASIVLTSFYDCKTFFDFIENTGFEQPDIIFPDLNMPCNEKCELLQRLLKLFPALLVVIYSTSTAEQDMDNALACGASAYVVKPENLSLLEKKLKEIMGSYSAPEPVISAN